MSFKYTEISDSLPEGVQVRYEVTVTGPHPDDHVGSVDKHGTTDWRWTGDPEGKGYRTRVGAAGALLDTRLAERIAGTQQPYRDAAEGAAMPTAPAPGVAVVPADHPPQAPLPQQPRVDVNELAAIPNPFSAFDGQPVGEDMPQDQAMAVAQDTDPDATEQGAFADYEQPAPQITDDQRARIVDLIVGGMDPARATTTVLEFDADAAAAIAAEEAAAFEAMATAQAIEQVGMPAEWAAGVAADVVAVAADPSVHGDGTVMTVRVINGIITIDCTSCADVILGTRHQGFALETLGEHVQKILGAQREAVKQSRADTWP